MINKIKKMKGFTLVELLIVIALISILSVAVLATINPIEQSNKARDAKYKNDAAEALGALERYYASKFEYPWNATTFTGLGGIDALVPKDTKMVIEGTDARFGILDIAGDAKGLLIDTSELKSSFGGKSPFAAPVAADRLYVYNNGSASNYVCFCPAAKANRTGVIATQLKCLTSDPTLDANDPAGGSPATLVDVSAACVVPTSDDLNDSFCDPANTNGGAVAIANMMCVPEGSVAN